MGRVGRAVVMGVAISLGLSLSGVALASPYTTVSRLPGVPAVLSWILHDGSTKSLSPSLAGELSNEQKSMFWADSCASNPTKPASATACAFGDTAASQTLVLYGDSFALEWVPTLNQLGIADHFRVLVYVRIGCPFADIAVRDYLGSRDSGCLQFRGAVISAINALRPAPQLVIATEDLYRFAPNGSGISARQWTGAISKSLHQLARRRFPIGVVIGTPTAKDDPSRCLADHVSNVQACNTIIAAAFNRPSDSRIAATIRRANTFVVDVAMLFCGSSCPDILHNTLIHSDRWHLSAAYAQSLGRSFGSLVGCIGKRAPRSLVPANGLLSRLLAPSTRPILSACKAAISSPFNL